MTYLNIDRGLTPSDVGDPYDGDKERRLLESIAKTYQPDQVFQYWQLANWAEKQGYVLPDGTINNKTQTKDY